MRILFFMAHAGHARNFESTLDALTDAGHTVTLALDRVTKAHAPADGALLQNLQARLPALSVLQTPRRDKANWSETGVRFRAALDYLQYAAPGSTQSERLRERAALRVPAGLRRVAEMPNVASVPATQALASAMRLAETSVPVLGDVRRFVARQVPHVVLVTPLVELGSPQLDYIRAAQQLGVPAGLLVASWDNLTVKGGIHHLPDMVTVWNDVQAEEARRLHDIPAEIVRVTGAPAYDHWFDWRPTVSRDVFCNRVGLDPARPYLLYVGSSEFVAPDEPRFVTEWVARIRRDPALADVGILVRPHPVNPTLDAEAWQRELGSLDGVAVYPQVGMNPGDASSRADYFHSMHFSHAVVGINTSALIESAIIGRAIHTVLTPQYAESQEKLRHFSYLTESYGGVLRVAQDFEEHTAALADSIANPGRPDSALDFVRSFVRPRGLDRRAADVMLDAIEELSSWSPNDPAAPGGARKMAGEALALGGRAVIRARLRRDRRARGVDPQQGAAVNGSAPKVEVPEDPGKLAKGARKLQVGRKKQLARAKASRGQAKHEHAAAKTNRATAKESDKEGKGKAMSKAQRAASKAAHADAKAARPTRKGAADPAKRQQASDKLARTLEKAVRSERKARIAEKPARAERKAKIAAKADPAERESHVSDNGASG